LTGILPATAEAQATLELSKMQSRIVDIFANAIYALSVSLWPPDSGKPALLAEDNSIAGYQLPLPDNQWALEMQHAHDVSMAMLQRVVVDYARGPGTVAAQQFIATPNDTESKTLCETIRAKTNSRYRYDCFDIWSLFSLMTRLIVTSTRMAL